MESKSPARLAPLKGDPRAGTRRSYLGDPVTGRVCRPSCSGVGGTGVRPYATLDEARKEGLRPCPRCVPERVTRRQFALARAKAMLDDLSPTPDLVALARAVGMGRSHLQRVFRAAFGMSPKQYALQVRASRVKAALRASPSVTQALYEAGHNTPRTLYDRATDRLGMTPLEYRGGGLGVTVRYTLCDLPGGRALLAATERGMCAVYLGGADEDGGVLERLRGEFPQAWLVRDARALAPYVAALHRSQPATLRPTSRAVVEPAFHERVWSVLGRLRGDAPTYADLATRLGVPWAEEAVTAACEMPPLPVPWPRLVERNGVWGTTGPLALAA